VLEVVLMVAVRGFEFIFDTFIIDILDIIANNYKQIYTCIAAFLGHLWVEAIRKMNVVIFFCRLQDCSLLGCDPVHTLVEIVRNFAVFCPGY